MRLSLLVNPTAGSGDLDLSELERAVVRAGHRVQLYDTECDDLAGALAAPADIVVVAGGDGTVAKVLRTMHAPAPIAICPLGSANNIARALGHEDRDLERLARALDPGSRRRFDVPRALGPWGETPFVEAVGFGPLACAIAAGDAAGASGEESIRLGREALSGAIADGSAARLRIELDGRALTDDFLVVEVLNIPAVGPRLALAPEADVGDGFLDVVAVPHDRRRELLDWLGARGPMPCAPRRARRVRISGEASLEAHVDDAVHDLGATLDVTLSVGDGHAVVHGPFEEAA